MPSDYETRYGQAIRAAEAAGLRRGVVETPLVRALRAIGLKPRPPHYTSFAVNVMTHGVVFTFVWGVVMWLFLWDELVPPAAAAVAALLAGLMFGLVVAFLYRATADRSGLPRWEDLLAEGGPTR